MSEPQPPFTGLKPRRGRGAKRSQIVGFLHDWPLGTEEALGRRHVFSRRYVVPLWA